MTPFRFALVAFAALPFGAAEAQHSPAPRAFAEAAVADAHAWSMRTAELAQSPPEAQAQGDPADQLYRRAREAFNRARYAEAAGMFAEVYAKYPKSSYAGDSYYWQAYALYRRGTDQSLRQALEALQSQSRNAPDASTRSDAERLESRILGTLAQRGDEEAARRLEVEAQRLAPPAPPRAAAAPRPPRAAEAPRPSRLPTRVRVTSRGRDRCEGQDDERMAVLDAVLQMDESRAVPILKRVLAQRDTASACLRRKAVFILSQHDDHPETPRLLVDAVRNDPDAEVREQAVFWLSQVDSREAVAALDSILRTSRDQGVQEKAVFALSQHDSPAAAQALRAFARRTDVPQSVRENTIFWLSQNDDPQNAAFLRELYGQVSDAATKERILFAMSQVEGRETQKWLLGVAGERGESVELRKKALFWASQAEGDAPEFYSLYETFTDREMKEHLIFVYSQNDSRAARDKLMAIVRTEKDKELRKKAIFWLGQSDDPRVVEFLSSLLDKPGA